MYALYWSDLLRRLFTPEQAQAVVKSILASSARRDVFDEMEKSSKEILNYDDPSQFILKMRLQVCAVDDSQVYDRQGRRLVSLEDHQPFVYGYRGEEKRYVRLLRDHTREYRDVPLNRLDERIGQALRQYVLDRDAYRFCLEHNIDFKVGVSVTFQRRPWSEAPLFFLADPIGRNWHIYPGIAAVTTSRDSVRDSAQYAVAMLMGAASGYYYMGSNPMVLGKDLPQTSSVVQDVMFFLDTPLIPSLLAYYVDPEHSDGLGVVLDNFVEQAQSDILNEAIRRVLIGAFLFFFVMIVASIVLGILGVMGKLATAIAEMVASTISTLYVSGQIKLEDIPFLLMPAISYVGGSVVKSDKLRKWIEIFKFSLQSGYKLFNIYEVIKAVKQAMDAAEERYRRQVEEARAATAISDYVGREYALASYLFSPVLVDDSVDVDMLQYTLSTQGGNLL